ncbi:MAG: SEL1-like repeat protein [Defluviitaleaceae bacterium]|nr:SEL1-like repeat protein [Defluviitaleaceae bacterium]MCL2263010.1 SEL1-like repeat protein [Defluviitaleaceae bacterium]
MGQIKRLLKCANEGDWVAQKKIEEAVDHQLTYAEMVAHTKECKRLAETTNDLTAIQGLAGAYYSGLGIEKSPQKAEYWYKKGIEFYNCPVCMFGLCRILITAYDEYDKAHELLLEAVRLDLLDYIAREELDEMVDAIATLSAYAKLKN